LGVGYRHNNPTLQNNYYFETPVAGEATARIWGEDPYDEEQKEGSELYHTTLCVQIN